MNETFVSVQGEGVSVGRPAFFIRLSGCNVKCPWCDTKYSWYDYVDMQVEDILRKLRPHDVDLIVITGGEPLLQAKEVDELIGRIRQMGQHYEIEIETNGTVFYYFENSPDRFIVSPKLHVDRVEQIIDRYLQLNNAYFKFVISTPDEAVKILSFIRQLDISKDRVMFMPRGRTLHEYIVNAQRVWMLCCTFNIRFSPRLQISIFDRRKGI